jgi:hypothetical protein
VEFSVSMKLFCYDFLENFRYDCIPIGVVDNIIGCIIGYTITNMKEKL